MTPRGHAAGGGEVPGRNPMRRPSDLSAGPGRLHGATDAGTSAGNGTWPVGFAQTERDRSALHVLLGLASMTPRRLLVLAQEHPTAAACLSAIANGACGSQADRAAARSAAPPAAAARTRAAGARLVAVGDPEYPPELLHLFDPPAGVFVRGRLLHESACRVAVVGARNCSPSGREMAEHLGRGLAQAGVSVVSGGARGIDGAAHHGALRGASPGGVPTVAVLGSGIDLPYPRSNQTLLGRIEREGALLSEYPPGTPAEPFRFPARNRIIAGLSRAVVVVEGAAASGSLITAEHALDIGREVFAVPGSVDSELASAPLSLIRDGATLIRGVADLLGDLGLDHEANPRATEVEQVPDGLSDEERSVCLALASPSAVDVIQRTCGRPVSQVLVALMGLELRGLAVRTGGRYRRRARGEP
jgi:DNA processing protein